MKRTLTFLIGLVISTVLVPGFIQAQNVTLSWDKTFGGSGHDKARSVQQTSDGGYIIAGETDSYGAGESDVWLIKTDAKGEKEWDKTFGGSSYDAAYSVQQTFDGGYIIAGYTYPYGAGESDAWLIKTDAKGEKQWDKTFGGSYDDDGVHSVQQTSDGGYIIAGYGRYYSDAWLIKTDAKGEEEWEKIFFGSDTDTDDAYSVQQTSDGGYIIAGETESYGAGESDVWLIKTDAKGEKEWDKTFGGSDTDEAYSVQQTFDGGYIIAGYTYPYGAGESDVWLIKTDAKGEKEWDKTFGGSSYDAAYSVQQTSDGGYIIAGYTDPYGVYYCDVWLIKTEKSTGVEEQGKESDIPKVFVLSQNYPNPFNASTSIRYSLNRSGKVTLSVYDSGGKLVKGLVNECQQSGRHEVRFDASSLPSGIYFYQLEAGNLKQVKKMLLVK